MTQRSVGFVEHMGPTDLLAVRLADEESRYFYFKVELDRNLDDFEASTLSLHCTNGAQSWQAIGQPSLCRTSSFGCFLYQRMDLILVPPIGESQERA